MNLSDTILSRSACYINGGWVKADSGGIIDVENPSSLDILGQVPDCGKEETFRAIEAASNAWCSWRQMTALERCSLIMDFCTLVLEHDDELARLMTSEQGKPLRESRKEVRSGAEYLRWFAEEGRRAYGKIIPSPWREKRILVSREPVGVVGIITPWNFPAGMICRKAGPALAVGCPVVIKPASQTPFSALALAELAQQAKIPKGVFNVVTGSPVKIGTELTTNPKVRKISFTGSTRIGKKLLQQCSETVKKISLELGGNAPFLIFKDADLDLAVEGSIKSKFRNSGQTCICANRFLVQAEVYDAFLDKFSKAVNKLQTGDGINEGSDLGPLIDDVAVIHVEKQVADALQKGGRVITGGHRHDLGKNFYQPTVIADASPEMLMFREEIFGPVAPVFRFETEDQAITMANNTEYGLAGYVYTRDLGRAWRVSEALEFGMVGVNDSLISTCEAPFGGIKESGFGREGSCYGLEDYSVLKYTCMAGLAEPDNS